MRIIAQSLNKKILVRGQSRDGRPRPPAATKLWYFRTAVVPMKNIPNVFSCVCRVRGSEED